jgi:selenide, water dikinase
LLAGVCSVLKEENCSLVGGHTSEGGELAVGLSVNGYIQEGSQTPKGPPRDGDLLILTKALGTGVILAADMRAEAKGHWVSSAIESMTLSNKAAAELLQREGFQCSGCTDVTGFGFMGHLLEMMKYQSHPPSEQEPEEEDLDDSLLCSRPLASSSVPVPCLEAVITLADVPLLDGAQACVELGVLSSLHPQVGLSSLLILAPHTLSCLSLGRYRIFVVHELWSILMM